MSTGSKDLSHKLKEAAIHVKVGAKYRHYKSPDMTYEVLALAIEEETLEVVVVYLASYGERLTFTRPLSIWSEHVDFEEKTVPRFSLI